jgi:hypothetical protein
MTDSSDIKLAIAGGDQIHSWHRDFLNLERASLHIFGYTMTAGEAVRMSIGSVGSTGSTPEF